MVSAHAPRCLKSWSLLPDAYRCFPLLPIASHGFPSLPLLFRCFPSLPGAYGLGRAPLGAHGLFSLILNSFLSKSVELNESLVMAYNNYRCLLRRLKRFREAIAAFEKEIGIDGKFNMARRNLQRTKDMMNGVDSREEFKINSKRPPAAAASRTGSSLASSNGKGKGKGKESKRDRDCLVM